MTADHTVLHPLLRSLAAECLKLKHTLALWLVLIAPGVVIALQTAQWLFQARSPLPVGATSGEAWQMYGQAAMGIWTLLMLPLYITLQSALIAAIDHQERQWKHLLTLAVPRHHLYLAKLLILAGLVALAMLVLVLVLIPLGGWCMRWRADLVMTGMPDLAALMWTAGTIYLCACGLMALHCFIALRWRSFTVAVAIGMSATVMGFIIGQSPEFGPWFPWTMALQPLTRNPQTGIVVLSSIAMACIVTWLGCLEFRRREFFD